MSEPFGKDAAEREAALRILKNANALLDEYDRPNQPLHALVWSDLPYTLSDLVNAAEDRLAEPRDDAHTR